MQQITAAQLNAIAELLGTTDKNVVYSTVLKFLCDKGVAADVAFDLVFGEGAYKKFAGIVYDALNAK